MRAKLSSAVLLLAFLCLSCASLEQTAYRTIGVVTVSVDGAMNGWGDYVRAGKASADEQKQVRAAYENYQAAMRVAKASVMSVKAGSGSENALDVALRAVEAASADLITLIYTLRKE